MNRNRNETESFAGNFVASDEQGLFFEVPRKRTQSTYLFGAVCPEGGAGAALVLPACNTEAMQLTWMRWQPKSLRRSRYPLRPPQFSCLKAGHGHGPRRPAEALRPALSGPPADA
jgi:hypothetical protein